jgi:hypothetical protein
MWRTSLRVKVAVVFAFSKIFRVELLTRGCHFLFFCIRQKLVHARA